MDCEEQQSLNPTNNYFALTHGTVLLEPIWKQMTLEHIWFSVCLIPGCTERRNAEKNRGWRGAGKGLYSLKRVYPPFLLCGRICGRAHVCVWEREITLGAKRGNECMKEREEERNWVSDLHTKVLCLHQITHLISVFFFYLCLSLCVFSCTHFFSSYDSIQSIYLWLFPFLRWSLPITLIYFIAMNSSGHWIRLD